MEIFPQAKQASGVIKGPSGDLEMLTTFPVQPALPYVAVICHPHPLHQGTMHNKVVTTLAKSVMSQLPTVRFNFRGVMGSAGAYGDGVGEQDDLNAVLDWVKQVLPDHQLLLMGFSFGGYVAASVANKRHDIHHLITVAPALRLGHFNQFTDVSCPWLVVYGDQDDVVSVEGLQSLVDDPPVKTLRGNKLVDAGHFFHGRLLDLQQCVMNEVVDYVDGFII